MDKVQLIESTIIYEIKYPHPPTTTKKIIKWISFLWPLKPWERSSTLQINHLESGFDHLFAISINGPSRRVIDDRSTVKKVTYSRSPK